MACFRPLTAGRPDPKKHGRTKLVFGSAIGAGMEILRVPCGQCIGCRLDHSLSWATRCVHESRKYDDNSFITLTYSDEHLPRDMSLSLKEFQKFAHRLRKRIDYQQPGKKIKIFHCGEYSPPRPRFIPPGEVHPDTIPEGLRPHYHAIIFNHDFVDKKLWSVRDDVRIYSSDFLDSVWGKGFCTVGNVTFESAAYVARYTVKKLSGKAAARGDPITGLKHYERVCPYTGEIKEVQPEYATMSNGIGKSHYHRFRSDIYPRDFVVINGHETRPPRYYDNLFDAEEPALMESIRAKRIAEMAKYQGDNTRARLLVREKVKKAQLSMLKREEIK